jgi:hypothetical protein
VIDLLRLAAHERGMTVIASSYDADVVAAADAVLRL